MAGTNEFAFSFAAKAYVPGGGVQNQAEKNSKNAFRPVPVQKFTFPDSGVSKSGLPNARLLKHDVPVHRNNCIHDSLIIVCNVGNGKRGHYERGLFAGEISRISKISKFSRISRRWSESPLFSTVWGFSRISKFSKFSRISRKWTLLKRPLFQKTPFSDPDNGPAPLHQL